MSVKRSSRLSRVEATLIPRNGQSSLSSPSDVFLKKNCENIFVSKEIITDIYVRFNKSVSYFTIVIHLQQIRYFTIAKSYFIIEIYLHQIRHLLQIRYFTIVKSYFTIVIYLQLHNDSGPSELIRFM